MLVVDKNKEQKYIVKDLYNKNKPRFWCAEEQGLTYNKASAYQYTKEELKNHKSKGCIVKGIVILIPINL